MYHDADFQRWLLDVAAAERSAFAMEAGGSVDVDEIKRMRDQLALLRTDLLEKQGTAVLKDPLLYDRCLASVRAAHEYFGNLVAREQSWTSGHGRGVRSALRRSRPLLAVRTRTASLPCRFSAPADGMADVRAQGSDTSLEIRGSGSVLPLAQRVAETYMTDHPQATIVVSSGGDRHGLKSLILGTCEMAMAGTEVPEDLAKLASDSKVELVSTDIYKDAVVVVVHPGNPVRDISMRRLRDVFRGAITNWRDLGGKEATIVVTTHEPTSSTFEIFKKAVLGDGAVVTPSATLTHHDDFESAISENAIGYTGLHDAGALGVLTIDGIPASVPTIASGAYPIRRTLRMYQRKPESSIGRALLDAFLAPDHGQATVRAMGDVPVN